MRARVLLLLVGLVASGCQQTAPEAEPEKKNPEQPMPEEKRPAPVAKRDPADAPALPDGFVVSAVPVVEAPFLEPAAGWRHLRARLVTAQSDARRRGKDLLVGFESDAVHITTREGNRTVWKLPKGLDLSVLAAFVVIRKDLRLEVFRRDGTQVPAAEEVTVAIARWGGDQPKPTEIRLVIKGSKAFRSMSSG